MRLARASGGTWREAAAADAEDVVEDEEEDEDVEEDAAGPKRTLYNASLTTFMVARVFE